MKTAKDIKVAMIGDNFLNRFFNLANIPQKMLNINEAISNTKQLVSEYDAANDPNAFHGYLKALYGRTSEGIIDFSLLQPTWNGLTQRIIAIRNIEVIQFFLKYKRAETMAPTELEEALRANDKPVLRGGRSFQILEKIGMGILSSEADIHKPFIGVMRKVLGIRHMDENKYAKDPFKEFKVHFIQTIKSQTSKLIDEIMKSKESGKPFKPDFLSYALAIFVNGFYPNLKWTNKRIRNFSKVIEEVSDLAFKGMMNPYTDEEEIRTQANKKLSLYIDLLLEQDQRFYLGKEYVDELVEKDQEHLLREIIIALLFAGGDNIRKFLEHAFIELGSDRVRDNYLMGEINDELIENLMKETARLYTTIYAQPAVAANNFQLKVDGKIFNITEGTVFHFSTFASNVYEKTWGEDANEFNPTRYNQKGLPNPYQTFGSINRRCEGKFVTKSIVKNLLKEVLMNSELRWKAKVDGKENSHQTEFGFNNGTPGNIEFYFESNDLKHKRNTKKIEGSYFGNRKQTFYSENTNTTSPVMTDYLSL